MKCVIDECSRRVNKHGLCRPHLQRQLKYGDPRGGPTRSGAASDFYNDAVLRCTTDDCVIWPFARNRNGYGVMGNGAGKTALVHRIACEVVNGPPAEPSLDAAHNCGAGAAGCVNPRHIRWATRRQNAADTARDGRTTRGTKAPNAKLTASDVEAIRASAGEVPQSALAAKYGIDQSTVSQIVHRKRWAWVGAPDS